MPFLALNGWQIPVAIGGEEKPKAIGLPLSYSHTGIPMTDARAYKREWRFSTIPLHEQSAQAIIAMIQGRGFSFSFDSTDYSGNGLVPDSGAIRNLRGLASDGGAVVDANGTTYGKSGAATTGGDVSVEPSTTNVIYAIATNGPNICTGTGVLSTTGGFSAGGTGAVTSSTAASWQGTRSLLLTSAAINDYVQHTFATVTANVTVTGSFYAKGGGSLQIEFLQNSGAPAIVGNSSTVTLSATQWQRIEFTGTLTGGNTTCAIRVIQKTAGAQLAYMDGFQIEEKATSSSWVGDGTGTRAAGQLKYSSALNGFDDITINAWVQCDAATQGAVRTIAYLGLAGNEFMTIYRDVSSNNLVLSAGDDASIGTATYAATWDGGWHMVTGVLRHYPETGETSLALYWDGTAVATGSVGANYSAMESSSIIYVGYATSAGTTTWRNGRIDSLRIVPFAAPATLVTGWYGLAGAMVATPKMTLSGNIIPETSLTVIGEINNVSFRPHQAGGAWRDNGRIIDFTLYEVSYP
jgi:hypothetical protein